MNPIARFECPVCSQPIETDEATARSGVVCPGCGQGFIPDGYKPAERAGMTSLDRELQRRRAKIQAQARSFTRLAVAFFLLAALLAFCALVLDWPSKTWLVAGSLLGVALWLYLVGQVIHIRANTER